MPDFFISHIKNTNPPQIWYSAVFLILSDKELYMQFRVPLIHGIIKKRYKRFLCDVVLEHNKSLVTAHCPNSGSMKGIDLHDTPVMLSYNDKPSRKLKYTLEMVYNNPIWIGTNTWLTNQIAHEGIVAGQIPELNPYLNIKKEVRYGTNSRIDLLLEQKDTLCYVEVKNVTLADEQMAIFPDSVTLRGQKHLMELIDMKKHGYRSVMLFIVQRSDCTCFSPAHEIDPGYAENFLYAIDQGVEAYAYQTHVSPSAITITGKIPITKP
jgi:sugar fermentation stimulation protein A